MKKILSYRTFIAAVALLGVLVAAAAFAAETPDKVKRESGRSMAKVAGLPRYQLLNIGNLWTWHRSDGLSNHSPGADNGLYYPRGTRWVIYQDAVMYGSKVYVDAAKTIPGPFTQLIRVGGGTYSVGTREGYVTGEGASAAPIDPGAPDARIYRVRRDYFSMTQGELLRDAAEYNETTELNVTAADAQDIYDQYAKDWVEWPVNRGAPFIDRNNDGIYTAPPPFSATFNHDSLITQRKDEPGIAGADPNSPADQVVWTAFNDLDRNQALTRYASEPTGLEFQVTLWGYKRTDAIGNVAFKRVRVTNKGGVDIDGAGTKGAFYIDSMYVAQWSDPDLGTFGDDICGCDVGLSMGFIYNGAAIDDEYRKFNLPVPAGGYDFLQGPVVDSPGDSAVFNLKRVYDKKNLGMTSFSYFSAGAPISDPPNNYEQGARRWYRMLKGFAPVDVDNQFYPFPPGVTPNKYPLDGDPVRRTGFIDGLGTTYSFPPGDRRINLSTGPFNLNPGEVQEFVVAMVVGLGSDRLSSVAVMKFNDRFAQNTYDALFQVPKAPLAPDVKFTELDGEVLLEWGSSAARVGAIENTVSQPGAYTFEGYNVYQLPSRTSSLAEAKRIATYDVPADPTVVLDEQFDLASGQILSKPVQFGSNSGITRQFRFKRDYVLDIDKIYNGQEYYLGVTAYSVATVPGFLPASLESGFTLLTVRSKVPFGLEYPVVQGDTLAAAHVGPSDGAVFPVIVDPAALNGHDYKVTFTPAGFVHTYNIIDVTDNNRPVLTGGTNQTGDDQYLFTDGFQLRVVGAPNSFKRILTVANAAGPLDPPENGCFAFNASGFPTTDGLPPDGVNDRPGPRQQANGAAGRGWGIHTADNGSRLGFDTFLPRVSNSDTRWPAIIPYDWEIRFTATGGYAYDPFVTGRVIQVPFELWRIGIGTPNDPSDDYRMVPYVLDDDESGTFNLCKTHPNAGANEHTISGGDNDPYTDWIYWATPTDASPGDAGYKAWEAAALAIPGLKDDGSFFNVLATDNTMRRIVLVNWNGGSISDPTFPANVVSQMPETGTVFRLVTTKPNTAVDTFTFTSKAPVTNATLQTASAKTIGVYPNPYFGFNPAETSRLARFVTFNNLSPKATIRIYNLGGQFVRRLDKDDNSQFLAWDLRNRENIPVASGIYLAHVEAFLPAGGSVTKVLKVAIIAEQETLEIF